MFLNTDAIVLRETRYKDADKILTVLTRSSGLQTVTARGVCRKGSALAASAQLLAYSQMCLFTYKDRASLREAVLAEAWLPLRDDIGRMILGVYAAEVCAALATEGAECAELLDFLLLTLKRLAYKRQPDALVKAVFELGMMRLNGYGPDASACAVCGEADMTNPCLHLTLGQLHCEKCKPSLPQGISMPLTRGGVAALRFISEKEPGKIFSFTLNENELTPLAHAAEAYMLTQLERGFQALDMYKRLL
ncbi:MAG: DNA repair protein RecO [Oscillospiraceae bacterium]|jgi:DNA repair protein RecO (recombination protein O)|nr:DNA repair protein RecO [Oscillospiraceae bacterium]